ncbi:MAG: TauD/TfdA family dioxygenase [Rhodospirillaceae bacterium]|nr:TauD/TfdA family dioxygenase [Rhodospirillaceae bacterium]MDD9915976.1 TauD/TfdA family dioxygenase [Rhodospirillaceae bacterium]MDD9929404.1 TauD/TfdA family dioxygenase [Rhodospirillaceae bacterium]
MSNALKVVPTGAALGADIEGVDLREIDDAAFKVIEDAWHDNLVLRFRGQQLDDDSLADFSARFGDLDMAPTGRGGTPYDPSRPEITVLSNIVEDGKELGALGNSELVWHQDMTYNDVPPKASLLHAREVPESGGDTSFYNMYRAYETLPADLRQRIQGLACKHDATRTSSGDLRHGYEESYSHEERPGAVHPFVIRHPATGKPALFLGRRPNAYVPGLSVEEGDALLDALWDHINNGPHHWTQNWRVGDLVIWDNRCALHRRNALDPTTRRHMHRTQVRDDARPVAAWAS